MWNKFKDFIADWLPMILIVGTITAGILIHFDVWQIIK
jgi:hypothetical protein